LINRPFPKQIGVINNVPHPYDFIITSIIGGDPFCESFALKD
jgi:hypothetical protein